MKQHEAVIQTLEKLVGVANLGQLNQEVLKIKERAWATKTPFALIRKIVVADNVRQKEYEIKIKYFSFKEIRDRVKFLNYESLLKQYEQHLQQQQFDMLV